jgi:hypothetical protein
MRVKWEPNGIMSVMNSVEIYQTVKVFAWEDTHTYSMVISQIYVSPLGKIAD